MFERYPTEWLVSEWWAPRPTTDIADLAPYVAELTVRESARVMPIRAIGLRLGEVVDSEHIAGLPPDPRWLHVEDAVRGVRRALEFEPTSTRAADRLVGISCRRGGPANSLPDRSGRPAAV